MLPRFSRVQASDDVLNRIQDRVKVVTDALANSEVVDGRLLDVSLVNGSFTPVSHGLQRPPLGYVVVRRSANAVVWDQGATADASSLLWLQSSAAVTVTLWVF